MALKGGEHVKVIAVNRRATHDYFIDDRIEAGLVLTGTEIKSIREGRVNLREGYARIRDGEGWLVNVHIAPYEQGNRYNHEPLRDRKLLLHKGEISILVGRARQRGYTLVPTQLYLKHGRAKIELGLARGKREFDKREAISRREAQREIERGLSDRRRGRD
ncbi:MAG: SsrA-binding protein SmpB [Chloroflexota bacterium]|nr:MAG: SsrA-binding protein [Chloroflexota bacterium]